MLFFQVGTYLECALIWKSQDKKEQSFSHVPDSRHFIVPADTVSWKFHDKADIF